MNAFRILDLPSELQSTILELVVQQDFSHIRRRYDNDDEPASRYDLKSILNLSLTHSQFRRIVLPFQYTTIDVLHTINGYSPPQQVKSLARALQDNPTLGRYCQRLKISIRKKCPNHDSDHSAYEAILRAIRLLPHVRVLKVDWVCDPPENHLFSRLLDTCVSSASSLEIIHLKATDLGLADAVLRVQASSLRKVKISGLYITDIDNFDMEESQQDTIRSNISELIVAQCRITVTAFSHLVNQPNKLETLIVSGLSDDIGRLDPALIVAMLKKHERSLKAIRIRNFTFTESGTRDMSMDFSRFTALEDLQLYRWSTHDSPEPKLTAMDADRLLAPRLRRFTWDFVAHDLRNEYIDDIKPPEVQWLRDLATAAVARGSTLAHIHAKFQPSKADLREHPNSKPASWANMDELKEEFASQGIRITYPSVGL